MPTFTTESPRAIQLRGGQPHLVRTPKNDVRMTDAVVRACECDWALAIRTPGGLFPNCAVGVCEWGARRAELAEAMR